MTIQGTNHQASSRMYTSEDSTCQMKDLQKAFQVCYLPFREDLASNLCIWESLWAMFGGIFALFRLQEKKVQVQETTGCSFGIILVLLQNKMISVRPLLSMRCIFCTVLTTMFNVEYFKITPTMNCYLLRAGRKSPRYQIAMEMKRMHSKENSITARRYQRQDTGLEAAKEPQLHISTCLKPNQVLFPRVFQTQYSAIFHLQHLKSSLSTFSFTLTSYALICSCTHNFFNQQCNCCGIHFKSSF